MRLSEKTFRVMDALDDPEVSNQRHISMKTGVSLGQVNYVLKNLVKKGLIKIENFRSNPNKFGYAYLLTPKGIEAKSRVAVKFIVSKLEEYDQLKIKLSEKLTFIEDLDYSRVVFVGPDIVCDFLEAIIQKNALQLDLIGCCTGWEGLKDYEPDSFDIVLLFDDSTESIQTVTENTGIPESKFMYLW